MTTYPTTLNRYRFPHLFKDSEKDIAGSRRAQQRFTSIATGGNEMQIAATVDAFEASRRGSALYRPGRKFPKVHTSSLPTLRKPRRMGHPLPWLITGHQKQGRGTRPSRHRSCASTLPTPARSQPPCAPPPVV